VLGTRITSCSPREALFVLEGLLENNTVLRLREHYTDTHGFTEHIFGLCTYWAILLCRGCAIWPNCLSLLSNAVLVWNTLRIAEIVNRPRAGHAIADQDLARMSPLMHAHVIPNGTYRFVDEEPFSRMYAAAG
jgi:TnpA family transposase